MLTWRFAFLGRSPVLADQTAEDLPALDPGGDVDSFAGSPARAVSAAPDLDGWALVERLLDDLAPLEERLWLVVDDVHELDPDQALRQLELLLMRAPPALRFVLATRHDVLC